MEAGLWDSYLAISTTLPLEVTKYFCYSFSDFVGRFLEQPGRLVTQLVRSLFVDPFTAFIVAMKMTAVWRPSNSQL